MAISLIIIVIICIGVFPYTNNNARHFRLLEAWIIDNGLVINLDIIENEIDTNAIKLRLLIREALAKGLIVFLFTSKKNISKQIFLENSEIYQKKLQEVV